MRLMTDAEIGRVLDCPPTTVYRYRMRIRGISPRIASKLEAITGIPRLAWLYPDEINNPYMQPKKAKKSSPEGTGLPDPDTAVNG